MGKTLVRASHRTYKKNAKGYTKRKIIIKKSRHTRNRRGGKLTNEEKMKFGQIKEEIKTLLRESSPTYNFEEFKNDVLSEKVNSSKYFKNFEDMYELWSTLTDDEKKKFEEDFFLKVGWGNSNRIPLYNSVLSDFKVHDGCKNTVRGNPPSSEMRRCLVTKFGVRPKTIGSSSNLLPYYSDLDRIAFDEWKKTNTLQLHQDIESAALQTAPLSTVTSTVSNEQEGGRSKRRPRSSRRRRRGKSMKSKKGRATRRR